MTGSFKWDLVNASKGRGFFVFQQPHPENTRDHHTHKLWLELDIPEKAAF